jgi:hypothetical protein
VGQTELRWRVFGLFCLQRELQHPGRAVLCCAVQAVRKMMDAKKLESTLNYDSDFKKSD